MFRWIEKGYFGIKVIELRCRNFIFLLIRGVVKGLVLMFFKVFSSSFYFREVRFDSFLGVLSEEVNIVLLINIFSLKVEFRRSRFRVYSVYFRWFFFELDLWRKGFFNFYVFKVKKKK